MIVLPPNLSSTFVDGTKPNCLKVCKYGVTYPFFTMTVQNEAPGDRSARNLQGASKRSGKGVGGGGGGKRVVKSCTDELRTFTPGKSFLLASASGSIRSKYRLNDKQVLIK